MKFSLLPLCFVSLLASACAKTGVTAAPANTLSKTVISHPGMVAAANPHAVEAGLEILKAGGSAVDAAIAIQTTLGLVEPQSSGLGGGAFMVVYDGRSGEIVSYDGRETAPAAITPDLFMGDDGKPLRRFAGIASGISTGVPGAMAMLGLAHDDYGTLTWGKAHMAYARSLAINGFKISPRMANWTKRMGQYVLGRQPAAREYFFESDGETTHGAGILRDNKPYAIALDYLANNPRALLQAPLSNEILTVVRENPLPGTLTQADMDNYRPYKTKALCAPYRDYTVCGAMPPASGGVAVNTILGILENFDMAAMGPSEQGWHHFAEASFLAYADRDQYVADRAFVTVPIRSILDKIYLSTRASLITPGTSITDVQPGDHGPAGTDATPDNPGTSHFTVVDKNGLVVSMTTTVEAPFGSQRMASGFMLNNQLTDFSFTPIDANGNPVANAPAPGKRPRSSMSPTIVFDKEGQFLFSTGSPGGNSIIAYTAKTIVGILDWGLTPQEAIDLPNVIARRGSIRLEENRMDADIIASLEAKGHKVVRSKGEISGLHIIYRQADGTLIGGADPRREGIAKSLK